MSPFRKRLVLPLYEFQPVDCDGPRLELDYPAAKAPQPGQLVSHGGAFYRRVLSLPSGGFVKDKESPSFTAPNWAPGAQRYGEDGTPYYKNDKQARSSARRMGYAYRD